MDFIKNNQFITGFMAALIISGLVLFVGTLVIESNIANRTTDVSVNEIEGAGGIGGCIQGIGYPDLCDLGTTSAGCYGEGNKYSQTCVAYTAKCDYCGGCKGYQYKLDADCIVASENQSNQNNNTQSNNTNTPSQTSTDSNTNTTTNNGNTTSPNNTNGTTIGELPDNSGGAVDPNLCDSTASTSKQCRGALPGTPVSYGNGYCLCSVTTGTSCKCEILQGYCKTDSDCGSDATCQGNVCVTKEGDYIIAAEPEPIPVVSNKSTQKQQVNQPANTPSLSPYGQLIDTTAKNAISHFVEDKVYAAYVEASLNQLGGLLKVNLGTLNAYIP